MTTTYCTSTETAFILSNAGQTAFLDDDENGTADADVTQAIEMAAVDMNAMLCTRYVLSSLETNAWCKWANARLAAGIICERRLNPVPDSLAKEIQKIWDLLNRIMAGDPGCAVPDAVSSFWTAPTVSNMKVQRGRWRQPVRVSTQESTGHAPQNSNTMRPVTVDPYP